MPHLCLTHRLHIHDVLRLDHFAITAINACGYRGTFLQVLRPLGGFATKEAIALYPDITAGDMMQEELRAINLDG